MSTRDNHYSIEHFFLQTAEEKNVFFSWCLDQKLYKEELSSADQVFVSRMKRVYEGHRETEKIMARVAFEGTRAVAIALLELNVQSIPGAVIKREHRAKLGYKVIKPASFSIHHVGFISLYVKSEHRQRGLARGLFTGLEEQVARELVNSDIYRENDIMAYQCVEKSWEIASDSAQWGYPIKMSPTAGNFKYEMSDLAQEVMSCSMGHSSLREWPILVKKSLAPLKTINTGSKTAVEEKNKVGEKVGKKVLANTHPIVLPNFLYDEVRVPTIMGQSRQRPAVKNSTITREHSRIQERQSVLGQALERGPRTDKKKL